MTTRRERLERLLGSLRERGAEECVVFRGESISGAELDRRRVAWIDKLATCGYEPGKVVGIAADGTPDALALYLAVMSTGGVAALVSPRDPDPRPALADAHASCLCREGSPGHWTHERRPEPEGEPHPLLADLRARGGAGFVVYSSGSEGRPKAVLHDIERFLAKYDRAGKPKRTLAFLMFDHIAGVDTILYTLAHGGVLVLPETRDPHAIARLVASARVEVLPTSPTFLKLFCLSDAPDHHDLSSLEIVAWGSEAMPASTSERVREVLPHVKLLQKFGTSELGSPRSRTRDAEGLWIDFDGIEHRIVDGTLWLRSETAMLGYLNAPNPFDEEGWWNTGDVVEQDGSWLRILGRRSDLINVGGEKVMPREVEEVLLEMPIIVDAAVRGAPNPLTGQIVEAHVQLAEPLDERELRKAVRAHCRARLAGHKVPARVVISEGPLTTERGKKKRREPEPR